MNVTTTTAEEGRQACGPVPTIVIAPASRFMGIDYRELWHHRELLFFLVWRDVKVRYKQTLIGAGWAVFQPIASVLVFTIIFSYLAKIPSDALPYPLLAFSGLLPWTYFSQSVTRGSGSLVNNAQLVSKVYFPRVLIPLASVVTPLIDLMLSLIVLVALALWYGILPGWQVIALPMLLLLTVGVALSVALWLSAANVRFRDIGHLVPFIVQIWMFASPVVYPITMVPEQWRSLYSLNPMVGVIEGFRWTLFGSTNFPFELLLTSVCVVTLLLVGGLLWFGKMQQTFSDVV